MRPLIYAGGQSFPRFLKSVFNFYEFVGAPDIGYVKNPFLGFFQKLVQYARFVKAEM